jgi:rhodanese-related sulfurtransferase
VLRARHIPGAVSAPLEELSARAKAGALGAASGPLAVVCASGTRSAQACVRLKRVLGFSDVANVRGGTAAWVALGKPLQQ